MAGNGVAANLFMAAILFAGLVALTGLEREAWPTVPFNQVEVSMAYPGATPEEVEESIVAKIEEQVESLDGVKAVKSIAAPGMASVKVEVESDTNINRAMDEIESAVNRIQSFPVSAERPEIRELTNRQSMIRLLIHGDVSEHSLKELAYQIEDSLAALPAVSQVEISGTRNYEISIEVPLHRLRALGLTLGDVADTIRHSSLELSAGRIETRESQVRVRTLGQRYDQQDFEEIVVLSRNDGTVVRLGDIAEVHDGFEDGRPDRPASGPARPPTSRSTGPRARRSWTWPVAVQEHIAGTIVPSLPDGVGVTTWNDESQTYEERPQPSAQERPSGPDARLHRVSPIP